jgi:hypothetical protein
MKPITPGTKVKLTGKFLRSTGQIAGGEGQKTWTVQVCPCSMCKSTKFVAVNEIRGMCDPNSPDYDAQYVQELTRKGSTTFRHIATCNLFVKGTVDIRNMP